MLNLRPYQKECVESVKEAFSKGKCRQLVSLPTGAGKTVIFANLIKETRLKTLVLAHTNELLTQAKDKINMICPGLDVGIVNGEGKEFDSHIVVSSIQSARQPNTLERLVEKKFDIVIGDECHHFAADTPRNVLNTLGFGKDTSRLLVGFTATAYRNDGKGLGEVFDIVTYQKTIKEMIDDGYLCRPNGIKVATDIDFSKVKTYEGDFQSSSLASLMDTTEINQLIVDSYIEKGEGRKAICFSVTVQHAHNIAYLFRQKGIQAQAVYGEMPKSERDAIIKDYQEGYIQVLCNCQLLTEGFDAPETSCVIVARPTKSRGLYQQMIGRGLRLFPNKKDCLVLDFCDKNHSLCNAAILTDDSEQDEQEEREEKERQKEIMERLPPNLNQKLKAALINFDPLGESFSWIQQDGVYFLKGSGNTRLGVVPEGNKLYRVVLASEKGNQTIAASLNFEYAFAAGEDFARENRSVFTVSDKEASWRNLPASEKQIEFIRKTSGCRAGLDRLTRGQASDLISSGALRRTG